MAVLTVSSVPHPAGLDLSDDQLVAANAGGDSFPNSGQVYLFAKNASGGDLDIVVDSPRPDNFGFSGNALDVTLTVPTGKTRVFGPFPQNRHNDNNGRAQLTYPGGVTGLTVKPVAM